MSNFEANLEQSVADFDRTVRPILEDEYGGRIETIELVTDRDVAKDLDRFAGIDAWWFTEHGVRGLASRIQWMENADVDEPYETFTVRSHRVTGTETELAKRQRAIAEGYLYPHQTVQAYIEGRDGPLLSMALCDTEELITYIERGGGNELSPYGRNSFYVVDWEALAESGADVTVWRADR